jgi:hypothetical protein
MMVEILFFAVVQLAFVVGFLLGRSQSNDAVTGQSTSFLTTSKNDAVNNKLKKLTIDDARFVTKVNDDKFTRNEKALGEKVVIDDDITVSVSKLAHLKKIK